MNFGGLGDTFVRGDFDGDGTTDNDDLAFWTANAGLSLQELLFADFDGNGVVGYNDLAIWKAKVGRTDATHADGDADGNGIVDGADFLWYQRHFRKMMTWVA